MSYLTKPNALLAALFAGLLALSFATGLSPAHAQMPQERFGDDNISAELYADGQPVAGEEWMLALRFTPSAPEWHGYWSNPGDAGQGMTLQLGLPDDWIVGEPLYPVPDTLIIAGLMNHIYEGEYIVLVPVTVGESANELDLGKVTAFVEFLACTDRICVPQDATLTERTGGEFGEWRAAVAPLLDSTASFEIAAEALRIGIPLPAAVGLAEPHVFIENLDLVQYAAPQIFRRDGDMLVAEIPLRETAQPGAEVSGILSFGDGNGVRFGAVDGDVPRGGTVIASGAAIDMPPFWILLAGALLGGLILNIMPCVFPILSLKALSLTRAGANEVAARREGLAYSAGVILSCIALGGLLLALRAGGQQIGWAFQLQEPAFVVALLVLASAITANFLGLFELPSLSVTRSGEPAGAFATGILAAFAATPCTGPFMAAALGAALLLPPVEGLVLFAALGLGLALPFLALGFIPPLRRMLPKPGAWMQSFRRWMALPMGLTALALLWLTWRLGGALYAVVAALVAAAFLALFITMMRKQQHGGLVLPKLIAGTLIIGAASAVLLPRFLEDGPSASAPGILDATPFSEAALAEARASGKPVFVWFTADWCLTCKVNENIAIEREETRAAFEAAGVAAIRGDWTRRDAAITNFLTEQGTAGVPLYLWYPAGEDAQQLSQVLGPDSLITLAEQADLPADTP